jgi:hypothetical protein
VDYAEFVQWMATLVEEGEITQGQAGDATAQRAHFDSQRDLIERDFPGRVVGFAAQRRFVADDTAALLDEVGEEYGRGRQVYLERVGEYALETPAGDDAAHAEEVDVVPVEPRGPYRYTSLLERAGWGLAALGFALAFFAIAGSGLIGTTASRIIVAVGAFVVAFVGLLIARVILAWKKRRDQERRVGS